MSHFLLLGVTCRNMDLNSVNLDMHVLVLVLVKAKQYQGKQE